MPRRGNADGDRGLATVRHLAEFNFGTLRHDWGDPRLADFENALDQVNAIAGRSPGFVWRLDDDAMDFAQNDPEGALKDRPGTASTLSVWTGAGPLYQFVAKTLHARFMARNDEWFVPGDRGHLVCWWVTGGHRPTVAEAMSNWRVLLQEGETENIFGSNGLILAASAEAAAPG